MTAMIRIIALCLCVLVAPSYGFFSFRSRIPNGEMVPHPCKPNYMWSGVGHRNPDGGGERNVFGQDFANAGYTWTQSLCRFDSDGDGKTNGEELGDPDCEWTEGSVPKTVTGLSHPGVCDPFDEGICAGRDSYVDCTVEGFDDTCQVIQNPDISTVEFRFQETEVPNTETNYYCQFFDFPYAGDYHIVADEGIIDNFDVVHHQILFGCPDSYEGSPKDDTPNPCGMNEGASSCNVLVAAWTVGYPGNCQGEMMGFRVGGAKGFKKFKLEIHYNNPLFVSGYTDSSGMRLYIQPDKPGVQDLGTFVVGQVVLDIPPGQSSVEFQGSCPSHCTQTFATKPMYIVSALSHMHYMGRRQKTEVLRNGQVIKVLADDNPYDYDSPIIHKFEDPVEVMPGDEVRTTCTYSSMSRREWVHYGDGTSDEMCFAFLNYYPEDALPFGKWCVQNGPLDTCDSFNRKPKYGCDWATFVNISEPETMANYLKVDRNCRMDGVCTPECKEIVGDILSHPCMDKEMKAVVTQYLQGYHEGAMFLGKIHSCTMGHDGGHSHDCKDCAHACDGGIGDDDWMETSGAGAASSLSTFVIVMSSVAAFLQR